MVEAPGHAGFPQFGMLIVGGTPAGRASHTFYQLLLRKLVGRMEFRKIIAGFETGRMRATAQTYLS